MLPIHLYNRVILMEEERKETMRQINIERRFMRSDSDPFAMTEEQFVGQFRLTKQMVCDILLPSLVPHMHVSSALAVSPIQRILITLSFYASGEYQRCIGGDFRFPVGQQTVAKCIKQVTNLIERELCDQWIQFPSTRASINRIKERFMEKTRFPGVLGAIDCTHIAIIAPSQEEHNYLNRKGYHSKNVQIVCDYDCTILNINARYPGASHDSFIFRQSFLSRELLHRYNNGDHNTWLLGDSGYPQKPYLMTPILNAAVGTPEFNYTERHVRARNCIERCNGLLKARFRCLSGDRKLRYNPEFVGSIVNACSVLHNICISGGLENHLDVVLPVDQDNERADHNVDQIGFDARRQLIQRYFT